MADKDYIKELKERDKAKPVNKYVPITEGLEPWAMCPKCDRLLVTLGTNDTFCPRCGQRLDLDNWAL